MGCRMKRSWTREELEKIFNDGFEKIDWGIMNKHLKTEAARKFYKAIPKIYRKPSWEIILALHERCEASKIIQYDYINDYEKLHPKPIPEAPPVVAQQSTFRKLIEERTPKLSRFLRAGTGRICVGWLIPVGICALFYCR